MSSTPTNREPGQPPHEESVADFADVLLAEMKEIFGVDLSVESRPRADGGPNGSVDARDRQKRAWNLVDERAANLSALCLSGGGIRSATFALGVMQGLARFDLLRHFHYLSSVSGGGYIASWLSAWRHLAADDEVFHGLNCSLDTGAEPAQITGIRKDSNYLTPQLGLLSADTWTVLALYVRNLLLNWLLFGPFFMGCFMVPRLCVAILQSPGFNWSGDVAFVVWRAAGAACVLGGLAIGIHGRFRKAGNWLTNRRFLLGVLLPLIGSGICFTLAAAVIGQAPDSPTGRQFAREYGLCGAAWGAVIYFIAWLIGRFTSRGYTERGERPIEKRDVFYWTLSGAVVGFLAATGMKVIATIVKGDATTALALHPPPLLTPAITVLGLSGFVLAYLAGELLYVGLASFSHKADMDREWLARSSGWLAAFAVGWALFSAIGLYGPALLSAGWHKSLAAIGGVSGLTTLILGASRWTAATQAAQTLKSIPVMRLASLAAIVFAAFIGCTLALLDQQLESTLHRATASRGSVVAIDALCVLVLVALAVLLSVFINVNRFSMHALYRNRLVRAFIGSARAQARKPDPFTGFDPADNLHLAATTPADANKRLFHVINATLNVVAPGNPAWQERKAESFTMSRLFCGNPYVGYRTTRTYGGRDKGGLTLGTAMAISGAAVSPNQGYNSSPLIGFLLMLFNVRLGWWLGSPKQSGYFREGPRFSLSPALRELAGDTTDDSTWIYLSDGGHFDNLGLYEMVRRRCRVIVVSDAGCDPDCTFEDLGNAIRKIYIDFGVSIDFQELQIKARQNPPVPGVRFAIGSIQYPGSQRTGWLLYIKPTYLQTTERTDIRSYASANRAFPHESTTDQWFSESQLESYRALGASIAEYICNGGQRLQTHQVPAPMTLPDLQNAARRLLTEETSRAATAC